MKDRITLLIKAKNLTAAQFADEIGVQKSSISHIISGRNNASLDFIQKIILTYPEVNMDWLMFGKGPIFKTADNAAKVNTDEGLSTVPIPGLAHVDLFSELTPIKRSEYGKENDLSQEVKPGENTLHEVKETLNETTLQKSKEQVSAEALTKKDESIKVSYEHNEDDTKTLVKIVEFYSDNTFREFFPG